MKYREKLGYIALGGFLMLVGMLVAGLFSPLRAQNEVRDAEFGTITCRRLLVEYNDVATTDITPAYISISFGEEGGTILSASSVEVLDEDGGGRAFMRVGKKAGVVGVVSKDAEYKLLTVTGVQ